MTVMMVYVLLVIIVVPIQQDYGTYQLGAMIRNIKVDGMEMERLALMLVLPGNMVFLLSLLVEDQSFKTANRRRIEGFSYVETKKAINSQCALCCSWNTLMKRYQTEIPSSYACNYEERGKLL